MIRVEYGFREFVREHRIQQLSRPRLALQDQLDGQWLKFRRQLRVLGENHISEFRVFAPTERGKDFGCECRLCRRKNTGQRFEQRSVAKRDQRLQHLKPGRFGFGGGRKLAPHFFRIDGLKSQSRREQLRAQAQRS